MKGLGILAVVCMSVASSSSVALQMTFGECSPIINLNLTSKEDLEKLFGPAPFQVEKIASATAALVDCARDHVSDASKRLEVLIFALDQQISLKENFLLPALRKYEMDHDRANLMVAERYAKLVSGKIEQAINDFSFLHADLDWTGSRLGNDQRQLTSLDESTSKLLAATLDKKMRMTLSIEGGYDRTILSVHEFVEIYEETLADLKSIRDKLKAKLASASASKR